MAGKTKKSRRDLKRFWDKLRKDLDLDLNVQFYSLRDSGIIQMLRDGCNPIDVKDQADHSSLAITNIYVSMARKTVSEGILKKSKAF